MQGERGPPDGFESWLDWCVHTAAPLINTDTTDGDLIVDSFGWHDDALKVAARAELVRLRASARLAAELAQAVTDESRHSGERADNECDICGLLAKILSASPQPEERAT